MRLTRRGLFGGVLGTVFARPGKVAQLQPGAARYTKYPKYNFWWDPLGDGGPQTFNDLRKWHHYPEAIDLWICHLPVLDGTNDTIQAKARAANPNTLVTLYYPQPIGFGSVMSGKPESWFVHAPDGVTRCYWDSWNDPVPNWGNPDVQAAFINSMRGKLRALGLDGWHWDGPPNPVWIVNNFAAGPLICRPAADIRNPPISQWPTTMAPLRTGLRAMTDTFVVPNSPTNKGFYDTESLQQDYIDYGSFSPLVDFWAPTNNTIAFQIDAQQDGRHFIGLVNAWDAKHAEGNGLNYNIALGTMTSPKWALYHFALFMALTDGVHDFFTVWGDHEGNPWTTALGFGPNVNNPLGTPLGPATRNGSVFTRPFSSGKIVTVDVANPPSASIA
jgi:hypothetical protein